MSQVLSQTFSQSQKPACIQCGGTEYVLESGHYFCADCQVQSQDIREEIFDDFGGLRGIKLAIPGLKSQELPPVEVSLAAEKTELTSWEALNIVLRGLVDELILLGAPSDLKLVALQLWAQYLMKIEAAFISKSIERKPRLGLTFRKRDAQLVYGIDKELVNTQKRPIYRPKRERSPSLSGNESSKSTDHSTRRIEKYRLTMKKKKLASAEYAASSSASCSGSELTLENLSAVSPGATPQKPPKISKLHYSKKAKTALLELLENATLVEEIDRGYLQNKYMRRHSNDLDHPTLSKLLVILRISLLILDSDIHLSDLLRWSDEGYLSLLNAEKLIPHDVILTKDVKNIFVTTLNSRTTINVGVMKMANALNITNLKSRLLPLVKRYLKELCLPGEIFDVIKNFIALKPPSLKLTMTVNYEARALGFIIFALKFLFGLDGVTEKRISKFASYVNQNESDAQKLFCWSEWVRYINCRNSFLSVHHQVSRDFYYPTSKYGGFNGFLAHWDKIPAKQTLSRQHIIESELADCMRRVLKGLSYEPTEPLAPSLEPVSSMLKTLLERDRNIPPRTKAILEHDFRVDSIRYLTDTNRQKELCSKYGVETTSRLAAKFVEVLPVPAEPKHFPFVRKKNKCRVKFVKDENKIRDCRSSNMEFNSRKGALPDSEVIQRGIFSKHKSDGKEEGITLPVLGRHYWVYHGGALSRVKTDMGTFDHIAESIFPPDFLWLLKEAARVGHVYPKEVYIQLKEVERIYLRFLGLGKKDQTFYNW